MAIPLQARDEAALQRSIDETLAERPAGEGVWLFVYGSLAASPPFRFEARERATLEGLRRSFCLNDPINRGTGEAAGLTLGLEPGEACEGLAFHLAGDDMREGLARIWRQEMRFPCYVPRWADARFATGTRPVIVFDTDRESPLYRPETDEGETVERIAGSAGPSGTNADYLTSTQAAFREAGIDDPYLARLVARLSLQEGTTEAERRARPTTNT